MQGLSKREYGDDMVTRRAVERTFVNLIQACIDLAKHIRSTESLSPSGTSKREIKALESAEIVSSETREHIEEAVGFRNLLTHRYGRSITKSSMRPFRTTSVGSNGSNRRSLAGTNSTARSPSGVGSKRLRDPPDWSRRSR